MITPPNLGDKFVAAGARGLHTFVQTARPSTDTVTKTTIDSIVGETTILIDKWFPTQGMIEHSLKGPMVNFAKNALPELGTFLHGCVMNAVDAGAKMLDDRAKAGGA